MLAAPVTALPQGKLTVWKGGAVHMGSAAESTAINADIVARDGVIVAIGDPGSHDLAGATIIDCTGCLVTPALIDCHTHLVHGGDRSAEFAMRLEGATYQQIAEAGGGIASTVRMTRTCDVDRLVAQALPRLDRLLADGVGTVEIKSGYGLTVEAELNMLRAARRLGELRPVRVVTSWLAAHALPLEYADDRAGYLREVVLAGLDRAHGEGLVDAVDAFCERIAFTPDEVEMVFSHAARLGLPVRIHAEQLSDLGGARMAASHGARSADHLEYLSDGDAAVLAEAGTVAVLLPGAFYYLREERVPPVAALREAGALMALATDCNPGTSPLTSLLLAMNMGATIFRMSVGECLFGTTGAAAAALSLRGQTGELVVGAAADIAVWNVATPAQLVAPIGFNPLRERYFKGRLV